MNILSRELLASGYSVSTLEEAIEVAPSISSKVPHPERTERYTHFSTAKLVRDLEKLGWEITNATQSGKGKFNRHIVRMVHRGMETISENEELLPQIVIDNSHDGLSRAMIHMGLYRVMSKTGMIISVPGSNFGVDFLHLSDNGKDLNEQMEYVTEAYKRVNALIQVMRNTNLDESLKEEFVMKAIAAREPWRFLNHKKELLKDKIRELNNIEFILTPARNEDAGNDLWSVFNTVHEKLINGGYERLSDKGRKSKTRPITIPSRNVSFNKALWEIANDYTPKLV